MHPLKTCVILIFGLFGCVAIPIGVVGISSTDCKQETYYITNKNITMQWPPNCPNDHNAYITGLVLLITGCVSLLLSIFICCFRIT